MANKGNKQYEDTKRLLETARSFRLNENKVSLSKKFVLTEDEQKRDAIAITNDPRFGQSVLQGQIDMFKQSVNAGAKFAPENSEDPQNNPLVYYPKTGNLIFSGSIPQLNNLKFQFSLNDVTGSPYIFVDGLALTEEAINVINKIRGTFLNWRDQWLTSDDLLSKLK